jgi:hypothetical protein
MTLDGKRHSSGLRSDQYKQTINELSSILNSVIPKKKNILNSIWYDDKQDSGTFNIAHMQWQIATSYT